MSGQDPQGGDIWAGIKGRRKSLPGRPPEVKGLPGKGNSIHKDQRCQNSSVKELETPGEGATDLQPGPHGMPWAPCWRAWSWWLLSMTTCGFSLASWTQVTAMLQGLFRSPTSLFSRPPCAQPHTHSLNHTQLGRRDVHVPSGWGQATAPENCPPFEISLLLLTSVSSWHLRYFKDKVKMWGSEKAPFLMKNDVTKWKLSPWEGDGYLEAGKRPPTACWEGSQESWWWRFTGKS